MIIKIVWWGKNETDTPGTGSWDYYLPVKINLLKSFSFFHTPQNI